MKTATTATSEAPRRVTIRTTDDARRYLAGAGLLEHLDVDDADRVVESAACSRCGGSGYGYWYPDGGICYDCRGANTRNRVRRTPLVSYARDARRREMAVARKTAKRRREAEAREEAMLEGQRRWCEEHGYGRITFEERDALREKERAAAREKSEHVGAVGERREFRLKLKFTTGWDSMYGYTTLHGFEDENGNSFIWKTTSGRLSISEGEAGIRLIEKGDWVTLKATVKDHGEYNGEKQTALSRAKLVKFEGPKESEDPAPESADESAEEEWDEDAADRASDYADCVHRTFSEYAECGDGSF